MVFKSSRKNGSLNHFSPGSPQSMALILRPPCRLTVVDASNDSMLSTLKKRKIDRRWQKSTFLHSRQHTVGLPAHPSSIKNWCHFSCFAVLSNSLELRTYGLGRNLKTCPPVVKLPTRAANYPVASR